MCGCSLVGCVVGVLVLDKGVVVTLSTLRCEMTNLCWIQFQSKGHEKSEKNDFRLHSIVAGLYCVTARPKKWVHQDRQHEPLENEK